MRCELNMRLKARRLATGGLARKRADISFPPSAKLKKLLITLHANEGLGSEGECNEGS
uniref:Uncharacterized protein n=1 Tax=Magnetococcus massalia (strain MO-1) TaxID=451514 RepID=A0A1S7LMX7_MAGMO|nr:protein of unknown function [Candidatus Magnetococcus massalia]